VYGMVAFLGLVGGALAYGVRSLLGYMQTKERYQLNLTRSLYYQNLDNNAGVLFRLLDEAEEQECREAMLAYFVLWREAPDEGLPSEALDRAIERLLVRLASLDVDFEIGDALEKLVRLRLVTTSDGRHRSVPIDSALAALDEAWDNLFSRCGVLPMQVQG
jgi:hypothetical protein